MEPPHLGGLSSLRRRVQNPHASSWRVGSCGRWGRRRPRSSLGGRAGGPGPLAHPHAESFPMLSRRFVRSKRNLPRLNSKVSKGGPFGRTAPGWKERCPLKRCACCRPETRFWRPQTGHCSSRSHGFDPNYGPSPCGPVLLVNGELVGTWRRQVGRVTVRAWRPLEPKVKEAVEEEVSRMPIESTKKEIRWSTRDVPL